MVTFCTECSAGIGQSAPLGTLERILWWLPENTETLSVVKGPFTIIDSGTNKTNDLKHTLEQMSYGTLSVIQQGKLLKPIFGQTVLLSVAGSRKFRPPVNLGSMRYEGCDILIFGQGFTVVRDSFIKLLETQATEVQKIGEYQVMMFEQKIEDDIWKVFIVSPKPNLVLCATDQSFLTDVLNRMESKAKSRAFPKNLLEWKQVDTTAQFWAVGIMINRMHWKIRHRHCLESKWQQTHLTNRP